MTLQSALAAAFDHARTVKTTIDKLWKPHQHTPIQGFAAEPETCQDIDQLDQVEIQQRNAYQAAWDIALNVEHCPIQICNASIPTMRLES